MKKFLLGLTIIMAVSVDMMVEAQTQRKITFIAPTRKKRTPQRISSSLSRGCSQTIPSVTLLTPPEHIGLTVSRNTQVFVYFQEKPSANIPIYLTLAKVDGSQAISEQRIKIEEEGVTGVQLPIELEVGYVYQWSITMICQTHPNRIDENEEVSGFIERVELPSSLSGQIIHASQWEKANFYASQGIWHDTLILVQNTPEFSDLLEQVGIFIK
jgi:hypothetical protein